MKSIFKIALFLTLGVFALMSLPPPGIVEKQVSIDNKSIIDQAFSFHVTSIYVDPFRERNVETSIRNNKSQNIVKFFIANSKARLRSYLKNYNNIATDQKASTIKQKSLKAKPDFKVGWCNMETYIS